jgi:hypothetical protein
LSRGQRGQGQGQKGLCPLDKTHREWRGQKGQPPYIKKGCLCPRPRFDVRKLTQRIKDVTELGHCKNLKDKEC